MAAAKKIKLYTVRNEKGHFIAAYYATTAQQAIGKHNGDQAQYFSFFRGAPKKTILTATVENSANNI
jgi:hypothetical protein